MIRQSKRRLVAGLWAPVLMAAVLALWLPAPALAQGQQVGSISVLEGQASVLRAGRSVSEALKVGSPLFQNDTIKTEAGGKLRVLFIDQSAISVAANTSLTITEYVFNPKDQVRSGGIKLLWGKVKCFVNDFMGYKSKRFKVQTNTAVIGVRGTVFLVWQVNDEITRVAAFQNEVTVANVNRPDEAVILGPSQMSQVVGRAKPTDPVWIDHQIYQLLHEGFLAADMVMVDSVGGGASGGGKSGGEGGTDTTGRPEGSPGTIPGGTGETGGTDDVISTTTTTFGLIDLETTTTTTLPLPTTTTSTTLAPAGPTELPGFPAPPSGPQGIGWRPQTF